MRITERIKEYKPIAASKLRSVKDSLSGGKSDGRPPFTSALADRCRALWGNVKAMLARKPGKPGAGHEPPISPKRSALMCAADIALALAVVAAGTIFCTVALADDDRIAVTLTVDDISRQYRMLPGATVEELLEEQNISLESGDELSLPAFTPLENGMTIKLLRAFPVTVKSHNTLKVLHVTGGTVGDALREAGVAYDVNDELSYDAFADVFAGMKIIHTDVTTQYATSYRTLEYRETTVDDPDVYNDTKPVLLQEGRDGTKQVTHRIVIKDGIEVSKEVVDQIVMTPAVDEITKVGTKIHYQTHLYGEFRIYKPAPKAGVNGWVEMRMDYITAYTGDTQTSTGATPKLGCIAVNTYYIPYGTEIYVPGYGYGKARDTGAFRNYKNPDGSPVNQLDLFMNTEKECRRWGRKRNVTVLVRLG